MAKDAPARSWTYVIQYRPVGAVKIGKSRDRDTLPGRVREIRTNLLPTGDSDVLLVSDLPWEQEGLLHRQYGDARIQGEYFRISEAMHEWLTGRLTAEHMTIVDGAIVTASGRAGIIGAPEREPGPTIAGVRAQARAELSRLLQSEDEHIRACATAVIMLPAKAARDVLQQLNKFRAARGS